jgi:hypothetical protein
LRLRAGAVGTAKHRTHHFFDHENGGIGQRHFHLDREGDERG